MKKTLIVFIALGIALNPFLIPDSAAARFSAGQTPTGTPEATDKGPSFNEAEYQQKLPLLELAAKIDSADNRTKEYQNLLTLQEKPKLVLNEKDIEAIREGKIDERVLQNLIYLVTPEEQGGANFKRLRIKRLVKSYSTEPRALSQETEYENENDRNISAHYKGQAIDLSEIDEIKMKKVTKSKALGVTYSKKTSELPNAPIRVAWQSDKGKGEGIPGFYGQTANELFTNLSLESLKEVLSDEVDYDLENLRGGNLSDWTKWLGLIILAEDFDLPVEGFEGEENNDFKGMLKEMGRAAIAQKLGIPREALKGDSKDDLFLSMGQSYLEQKLGLKPGSLAGDSVFEIFKSAGRRKLEAELGLEQGALDKNFAKKTKENPAWKTYANKDEAFDLPPGAASLIEAGDETGLALAGAGVLTKKMGIENKQGLFDNIKRKQAINYDLKIVEADLQSDTDPEAIKDFLSADKNKRKNTLTSLAQKFMETFNFHPDLSLGLTQKDWQKVLGGELSFSEMAQTAGTRKFELELGLPPNALYYALKDGNIDNLTLHLGRAELEDRNENLNKYTDAQKREIGKQILEQRIAGELNGVFDLKIAGQQISGQDIIELFKGNWFTLALKIGGRSMDDVFKFPLGGAIDLIMGRKSADSLLQESGAIRLGNLLGLRGPVSWEGNLTQNYGQSLVEETLGLARGSFSGGLGEVKAKNAEHYDRVFSDPSKIDALLGIPAGTTKNLLDGKISLGDYNKKAAERGFAFVGLEQVANFFGLESWKGNKDKEAEIKNLVSALSNWDGAPKDQKTKAISTLIAISGQPFDEAIGFEAGTLAALLSDPSSGAEILLAQGMKKLSDAFGFQKDFIAIKYDEGKISFDFGPATSQIMKTTGIENISDAESFLNGNIGDGFMYWGVASIIKDANDFLPSTARLSYSEARRLYFGDPALEEQRINQALADAGPGAQLPPEIIEEMRQEVRKEVRGELRKDFQYRVYDGYLRKINPNIPAGFSRAMFEGNHNQQIGTMEALVINLASGSRIAADSNQLAALNVYLRNKSAGNLTALENSGFFATMDVYLASEGIFDSVFKSANIGFFNYSGISKELFALANGDANPLKGRFNNLAQDLLMERAAYVVNRFTGGAIAFDNAQIGAVWNYLQDSNNPAYRDALQTTGAYGVFDNFITQQDVFGFHLLSGTSEALFNGFRTGDYNQLERLYSEGLQQFVQSKVFGFADKVFGFPAGTAYQVYQQYQNIQQALSAFKASSTAANAQALQNAVHMGIALIVHLAFGKQLAKVDQALGLGAGTTENVILFLLTGNPIFLAMAIVANVFTTKIEIYGEKPVCEIGTAVEEEPKPGPFGLGTGLDKTRWERLSGDPEKDFPFYQTHARCSVKRMLGAQLDISNKLNNEDIKPVQILTLRKEDVDNFGNQIRAEYGWTQYLRGLRGLMYSDTMWQWIHVGY